MFHSHMHAIKISHAGRIDHNASVQLLRRSRGGGKEKDQEESQSEINNNSMMNYRCKKFRLTTEISGMFPWVNLYRVAILEKTHRNRVAVPENE